MVHYIIFDMKKVQKDFQASSKCNEKNSNITLKIYLRETYNMDYIIMY